MGCLEAMSRTCLKVRYATTVLSLELTMVSALVPPKKSSNSPITSPATSSLTTVSPSPACWTSAPPETMKPTKEANSPDCVIVSPALTLAKVSTDDSTSICLCLNPIRYLE